MSEEKRKPKTSTPTCDKCACALDGAMGAVQDGDTTYCATCFTKFCDRARYPMAIAVKCNMAHCGRIFVSFAGHPTNGAPPCVCPHCENVGGSVYVGPN